MSPARADPPPDIDPEALRRAYRATDYVVDTQPAKILRVDAPVAGLDAWLAAQRSRSALVITAFNPFSRRAGEDENRQRQDALLAAVRATGLRHVPARGIGRDGAWPPEPSLCVFDAGPQWVEDWLVAFAQAAVVVADGRGCRLAWHPGLVGRTESGRPRP